MRYHLFAHNDKNLVKKGDKVIKYKTKIGTIGTGNGAYYAHLHHSVSEGLTVAQLRSYIVNWSKEKVLKYYEKPTCDYAKMFGRKMDMGKAGYDWLQWIGNGYHPGLDVNGTGGGNSDVGYEFKSSCDGTVIYVSDTTTKDGWGKMVIVEEAPKVEPKNEPVTEKIPEPIQTPSEPIKTPLEVNSEPLVSDQEGFMEYLEGETFEKYEPTPHTPLEVPVDNLTKLARQIVDFVIRLINKIKI